MSVNYAILTKGNHCSKTALSRSFRFLLGLGGGGGGFFRNTLFRAGKRVPTLNEVCEKTAHGSILMNNAAM